MLRRLKWVAAVAALLVAVMIAGAWWVSSSPTALQWLVAEGVKRSNGALLFEGVSGSLLGRVQVRRLTYRAETLIVRLEAVSLALSRDALMRRRLEVVEVEAALMEIETLPSAKPSQPPDTLALPFAVDIKRVRIAQGRFQNRSFENLAFAYRGDQSGQALREFGADTPWGRLTGELSIGATRPFALAGEAQLTKVKEWQSHVTLAGSLLETQASARGTASGATLDASARMTPYEAIWLQDFRAHGENIDTARFAPDVASALLAVDIAGAGTQSGWPAGKLTIRNATPGEVTANRIPLTMLSADYRLRDGTSVELDGIAASLGKGGLLAGSARLSPDGASADLTVRKLDLRVLHAPLRATQLNGTVKAEITGAVQRAQINVAERGISLAADGTRRGEVITLQSFRAQAGGGTVKGAGEIKLTAAKPYRIEAVIERLDPAAFGDFPRAAITGRVNASGTLSPQWQADVALQLVNSVYREWPINGTAKGVVSAQGARDMVLNVNSGTNTLHASGSVGRPGDTMAFTLDAPRLATLYAGASGHIAATGRVSGDLRQPQFDVEINGKGLVVQDRLRVGLLRARADGTLSRHTLTLAARDQDYDLATRVEGGWDAVRGWSGNVVSLQNTGTYPLQLLAPMPLTIAQGRYTAGPAQIAVAGGRATLSTVQWRAGTLETRGDLANVPFAPLLALAGTPAPRTTMRISGSWSITTARGLNGQVTLARESGDIVTPGDTAIALGLERLTLDARLVNGALEAKLDVLAQTIKGSAQATATSLSPDAALNLSGNFDIASLRVLDPLLGTNAFVRGNAVLTVNGSGRLGAPQLTGSVVATNLAVDAPQYGVRLRDGRLRAELDSKELILKEFYMRGDEGTLSATGTMMRATNGATTLAWRADHLRVLSRPEMRLKIDGSGTLALVDKKLIVRGTVTADEGHFEFDAPKAPTLGSDIVVLGRPQPPPRSAVPNTLQTELLDVDVTLDAGNRFRVVGAGLNTELRGKLNIKSNRKGLLEARGVLASVRGVYYAFGQRLDIERGRLLFDGLVDNPGLDILAKRRNLAVEPGVEVTGTLKVPNVRLISDPPVSDSEKLAWLTLGHGLQDATGADVALLQSAAYALIGKGNAVPLTQRIANKLGLDELSLKGSGDAGGQVAAVGKRLSDKLYVEYQQGLAATSAVLRLSLALTRSLSLRLEAGFTSSLGVYFTRSYK